MAPSPCISATFPQPPVPLGVLFHTHIPPILFTGFPWMLDFPSRLLPPASQTKGIYRCGPMTLAF